MDYPGEQVSIVIGGNCGENVSTDDLAAARHASGL
jgi:hypothetical protein